MSDDLRRLLRTSLIVGASVACVGVAIAFSNGEPHTAVTPQLVIRFFLAGSAMPFCARLSGRAPADSRVLLNVATLVLVFVSILTAPYLLPLLALPALTLAALTTERFHRLGVVLMFVGLAVGATLWLWSWTGGLYLPPYWWGGMVGILLTAGFWILLLTWALHGARSWRRWRIALPALVMGVVAFLLPELPLATYANARFLARQDLSDFGAQVLEFGRIEEMLVEGDSTHLLNGTVVRTTQAALDSVSEWRIPRGGAALLAEVLARDSIDPAVHDQIRKQMRRFHFRSLRVDGDYVFFARTRESGLLYARLGAPVLQAGAKLPVARVKVGKRQGQWYFACW